MPTLYVRDLSEEARDRLKEQAARNRRSMSAEAAALLEEVLLGSTEDEVRRRRLAALQRIIERSRRYKLPEGAPDSVTLLREDRDR